MRWRTDFESEYDKLILDPLARSYFGADGFYNVGYWEAGVTIPSEASRALTDRLAACIPPSARIIADVGCGLGATTRRLSELRPDASLLAINFSLRQLAVCRHNCPGALLVQMDAACLALASSSLDAIVSVEAPFHFCTRLDFFGEAARVLRPGGMLAMADMLFPTAGWHGSWTVPKENYLPDPEAYRDQLVGAGFQDIHIEDATEKCWTGFCNGQEAWSQNHPSFDDAQRRYWRGIVAGLRRGVSHYLLIYARAGDPAVPRRPMNLTLPEAVDPAPLEKRFIGKKIVMVMGVQRSGTTALFDALSNGKITAFQESPDGDIYDNFYLRPESELRPLLDKTPGAILLKPISETFRRGVREVIEEYAAYDLHIVWIYRDPVNASHFMQILGFNGRISTVPELAEQWNQRNQSVLDALPSYARRITIVCYEDLAGCPSMLAALGERLGIGALTNFRVDSGGGRRDMAPELQTLVDAVTRETRVRMDAARSILPGDTAAAAPTTTRTPALRKPPSPATS